MAATSENPFTRPLGITASVFGIVQGVVWMILALLAVLIYLDAWEPKLEKKTYGEALSAAFLACLTRSKNITPDPNLFVYPVALFIWTILYFIISIVWVGVSAYQLYAVTNNQANVTKKAFNAWGAWTTVVCVADLVLTSFLASDYIYIVDIYNTTFLLRPSTYTILAYGILMTLAARGFVLWIINLTFAILIMKLGSNKGPATIYTQSLVATPYGQAKLPEQGYHNPNFNTWEANRPDFTRSDSFIGSTSHPPPEHLPNLPPIASTNDRLAKIGKQQHPQSPIRNVPPPKLPQSYIYPKSHQAPDYPPKPNTPDRYGKPNNNQFFYPNQPRLPSPDYSPPHSPLQPPLKSALKNRSENVYGYGNSSRY